MRLKNGLTKSEFARLQAIGLLLAGADYPTIERATGLGRSAVFYLVRRIEAHGVDGMRDRREGRSKAVAGDLFSRVLELLVMIEKPTANNVCRALHRQDGTRLTPRQLRRLLKRWKLHYRPSRFRDGERTEGAVAGSIDERLRAGLLEFDRVFSENAG